MNDNNVLSFLSWANSLRRRAMSDDTWQYLLPDGDAGEETDWLNNRQLLKYWQKNRNKVEHIKKHEVTGEEPEKVESTKPAKPKNSGTGRFRRLMARWP